MNHPFYFILTFFFSCFLFTTPILANPGAYDNKPNITCNKDGSISTTTTAPDGTSVIWIDKPDGTTITTVIHVDGFSVKTINNADGSSVKTIDNTDGSSVKVTTYIDGSWIKTTTTQDGKNTTEKGSLESPTQDPEAPSPIPSDPQAPSKNPDTPSSTPSDPRTPSKETDQIPAFAQKTLPLNIKLIPVYTHIDENGMISKEPEAPFLYLSESCITGNEYCAFLNAVATKADPYGLYCEEMAKAPAGKIDIKSQKRAPSPHVAQIERKLNNDGTSSYAVVDPDAAVSIEIPGRAYTVCRGDLPISYVNLHDAARFCNWLHHEQPIGPEGVNTTETGAYLFDNGFDSYKNSFSITTMDYYQNMFTGIIEQPGARWSIPSIDSYLGQNQKVENSQEIKQAMSGLYENYGMFYCEPELNEWTSTRGKPLTYSDILYSDKSHPHDHNLITKYQLVNGPTHTEEAFAVTYQSNRVPKSGNPPPAMKDGFTTFRVMKMQ